ncbi:monovalent cation/H+ antiporter complex subunit F [Petrotoga sp. 9PWA.NaAc.5.4]|uniref:monovalent cation/H+ antiporter complex subunit F n=1 Tax=Petrotoga sp. 9PWA.NaAc.5.4 TaxID=1434328 RepID=UPI000CAE9750|nr:monovalent cation/H+ antiporter complex subunit F [Petrotoga sp. 9PWA.NaAc.5.4]PNR92542.1 hypothetical protein X924_09080 [Petrotoga sp. 9PWA.NaAc.5.4]
MTNILEIFLLVSMLITLIKFMFTASKWEKVLAYSSFSSKAVLLMLVFAFISDQLFLLDVIIIFLILNVWGIVIISIFLERKGDIK